MKKRLTLIILLFLTSCTKRVLTYSLTDSKGIALQTGEVQTEYWTTQASSMVTIQTCSHGDEQDYDIDCSYQTKNHSVKFSIKGNISGFEHKKTVSFNAEPQTIDIGQGVTLIIEEKN
jgi:hypothetical protein